jgi:hypothetical protein
MFPKNLGRTRAWWLLHADTLAFPLLRASLLLVAFALPVSAAAPAIDPPHYSVRPAAGDYPAIDVFKEGRRLFRLPLVSGLSTLDLEEKLSNTQLKAVAGQSAVNRWGATADSSLWTGRRFQWTFAQDHIEFQQFATGARTIERCYFFSNGISDRWTNGSSPGVSANTTILADRYFSPSPKHADQSYFTIAMPHSVGIGDKPGNYLFNALEYSGSRYAGASFWVNYGGYNSAA